MYGILKEQVNRIKEKLTQRRSFMFDLNNRNTDLIMVESPICYSEDRILYDVCVSYKKVVKLDYNLMDGGTYTHMHTHIDTLIYIHMHTLTYTHRPHKHINTYTHLGSYTFTDTHTPRKHYDDNSTLSL